LITSRAAGISAMVLSSAAVGYGLTMAGKLRKGSAVDRLATHEALSLAVMLAIAVHGLALLGDTYLRPTLVDITVPFALSYKQLPSTLGIVAGWGLIFLGLSYYLRKHIGAKRWKLIHRFTVLAWVGAIVHACTEGTDAGLWWFIALVALCTIPVLVLLALRVGRSRGGSPVDRRYAGRHGRARSHSTARPGALGVVRGQRRHDTEIQQRRRGRRSVRKLQDAERRTRQHGDRMRLLETELGRDHERNDHRALPAPGGHLRRQGNGLCVGTDAAPGRHAHFRPARRRAGVGHGQTARENQRAQLPEKRLGVRHRDDRSRPRTAAGQIRSRTAPLSAPELPRAQREPAVGQRRGCAQMVC